MPQLGIRYSTWIAISILAGIVSLFSQNTKADEIDIDSVKDSLPLGKHLDLLADLDGNYTIADVSTLPISDRFTHSKRDIPNFGYTSAVYWTRFTLTNPSTKTKSFLLELDFTTLDYITLYTPRAGGGFEEMTLGDQVRLDERTIPNRNPVFQIEVKALSSQVYYTRLSTEGPMRIPLKLHNQETFYTKDHNSQMIIGIYIGILMVMAIYNLFLFFSIRDKTYLAYVGYVVSVCVFNLSLNGVLYEYVFHDFPQAANTVLTLSVPLLGATSSAFTTLFLKTRDFTPRLHKTIKGVMILFGLLAVANLFLPYAILIRLGTAMAVICSIILACAGTYVWKGKGYSPARFYVFSWAAFLIGSLLLASLTAGILPVNFITLHGQELGSVAEVLLLSFALADRISSLEKEKDEALSARYAETARSESVQKASAQSWQSTFDAISAGVCLLDEDGRVVQANRAAGNIMNRSSDDLIGTRIVTLLEEFQNGKDVSPGEIDPESTGKDRSLAYNDRWYSVMRNGIIDEQLIEKGSVHIMTDVTEQRELEQEFYQSQKMDAMGRLAGGVAHDFNNLLAVIISYGEFLVESAHDAETKSDAEEIVKAGRRAAKLTKQLLVFSRRQVQKLEVLSPNEVVNDISKMLERLIGERHKLTLNLNPTNAHIIFDRSHLEQVIVNLVVNARDALSDEGDIVIETDVVELRASRTGLTKELPPGQYAILSIIDNGVGMDKETSTRIFEPFFTTKEVGKGTGLGLAMVYGSVNKAGGAIEVNTAPNRGTKFTVYLESVDANHPRLSMVPSWTPISGWGKVVLVIDDEAPVRGAVCKILRTAGYTVYEAGSGTSGLEMLQDSKDEIDLLITDIIMPEMSGVEVGAAVHKIQPDIKILYMTGYGFESLEEHGVDPESIQIIEKPFTKKELLKKLSERD